jgi:hypothetical protein
MYGHWIEAAQAGLEKALAALKDLNPPDDPPYMLPRLVEGIAKVLAAAHAGLRTLNAEERPETDPWEAFAVELDPANWTPPTSRSTSSSASRSDRSGGRSQRPQEFCDAP